jgi:hypothetical protein
MKTRTKIKTIEEFNEKVSTSIDGNFYDYNFTNCDITIEIKFNNAYDINFENCIFKENVTFPSIIKNNSSFEKTTFEKKVTFSNSTFNENVRFYGTIFKGKTDFDNTKFQKLADFWTATFECITIFHKTDFLGTTVFSSTTFEENVLFPYTLIDKLIIFRGTVFKKGFDLSLAIISGELSVFDIKVNINEFDDFNDTDNPNAFAYNVSEIGEITRKNKRETFRIIKYNLNIKQNSIDAIEFYKHEMNSYAKQLEQHVFKDKNIKEIQNLFLLYLNILSNKHGTSWWRGVLFTLSIGLFFFYISILSTENYEISIKNISWVDFTSCVKYFFTFMLPTHSIDYLNNERPKMFFYLWDFLGRIFISYGIYQTIQAFRKYKTK